MSSPEIPPTVVIWPASLIAYPNPKPNPSGPSMNWVISAISPLRHTNAPPTLPPRLVQNPITVPSLVRSYASLWYSPGSTPRSIGTPPFHSTARRSGIPDPRTVNRHVPHASPRSFTARASQAYAPGNGGSVVTRPPCHTNALVG